MEISLPDEAGRAQILNIHTSKMRKNGVLDDDVDLLYLAAQTKNFSGAELNGLIKSATSFAFNRHVKVGTMAGISDDVDNLRVNAQDFEMALGEVHPAFGVSEEELEQVIQNGIIHYDNTVGVSILHVGCESMSLTSYYRKFSRQVSSSSSRYGHRQGRLWSASSSTDPPALARPLSPRSSRSNRNSLSSSWSPPTSCWVSQRPKRLTPSPKSSRTATRVLSVSLYLITLSV